MEFGAKRRPGRDRPAEFAEGFVVLFICLVTSWMNLSDSLAKEVLPLYQEEIPEGIIAALDLL